MKAFTVEAPDNGKENMYIQKVYLNVIFSPLS